MAYYNYKKGYRKNHTHKILALAVFMLVFVGVMGAVNYSQKAKSSSEVSLSELTSKKIKNQPKNVLKLPWPDYGQSAYGTETEGVVAQSKENQKQVPTASLAKIITALAVLEKKPLSPGEDGPKITLTAADEKLYQDYLIKDGTVAPVIAGENITELQALQAMLLPSANNIADSLAVWAFGSTENYTEYANEMLSRLSLEHTTVADASGFDPNTKSTAAEMVDLGLLYIKNPVLKGIAMQQYAEIPFAGTVKNFNSGVNGDGLVGIKIGYTDEAGRGFIVADLSAKEGETSVVAVMGSDNLPKAMNDAKKIIKNGNKAYEKIYKNEEKRP